MAPWLKEKAAADKENVISDVHEHGRGTWGVEVGMRWRTVMRTRRRGGLYAQESEDGR